MSLVVICGQPCSGKSIAALYLAEVLKKTDSKRIVRIIDETSFQLDRNRSYVDMPAENLRGVLRSEVDRSLLREYHYSRFSERHRRQQIRVMVFCSQRRYKILCCIVIPRSHIVECGMASGEKRENLHAMMRYLITWQGGLRIRIEEMVGILPCMSYSHPKTGLRNLLLPFCGTGIARDRPIQISGAAQVYVGCAEPL